MFYNERPRTWKWMLPAMLVAPMLVITVKAWGDWKWGDWAMIPAATVVVLFLAVLMNGWNWAADYWSMYFERVHHAQNETAEVRMFEAAKGMHPDSVQALLMHRRTVWRIKYVPLKDVVDWVLEEAPTVHGGFIDFVLDHSNGTLMAKGLLSQGSKQFDPEGIVTDYQQYDDLVALMQQKLMITSAAGNQSPKWIPPWNKDLARHRFGMDGEGYGVNDEMSGAMKAVMRAQAKSGGPLSVGSGQLKEMPSETRTTSEPSSVSRQAQDVIDEERKKMYGERDELSDDEWAAVQAEMKRNAEKYRQ